MKLVLIDRDGVVNVEVEGYVTSPEQLAIMPEALQAFALLHAAGFVCVILTNQSVVGRGLLSQAGLDAIHNYLQKQVEKHGGKITEIIACTDHPDKATHRRKPGAGMLLEALEKYGAKPEETPFIGDALTDMQAALSAGCQRYLVMTGKGKKTAGKIPIGMEPVIQCETILQAAIHITANG